MSSLSFGFSDEKVSPLDRGQTSIAIETSQGNFPYRRAEELVLKEALMQAERVRKETPSQEAEQTAERIYKLWDEALGAKDVEAAVALYAKDVVLESPLVRHMTGGAEGVVRGRDNLREFVRTVFERTPPTRKRYRTGFFTDGQTIMWEYPREAPEGDQMDFVEVMEIENGLIQRHRVYWGWFGVKTLEENRYRIAGG